MFTGTAKTINFPFGTNGKLMVLGVPKLKHLKVYKKLLKNTLAHTVQSSL